MKIKRFVAADMRTAMNLVRKEHGPDAVILSNRRIEEGVEIVAAAHYDETAVKQALEASRPAPPAPTKPRSAAEAIMAAMTRRKTPEPEPVTATTSAVAALARSAVGATGRSIDNSIELAPGSRFAGLLRSAEVEPVAARAPVSQTFFATQPASADELPVVPAFRPAGSAAAVAPLTAAPAVTQQASFADAIAAVTIAPPVPVERARFVIDPPEPELAPLQPAVAVAIPAIPAAPMLTIAAAAPAIEQVAPIAAPVAAFTAQQPAEAPVVVAIETTAPAAVASIAPVSPITTSPVIIARDDEQLSQLRQEVAGMRHLIEREMNRFTDERLRGSAVRANALDLMDE
ncbi:MAG: hypothetical protein RR326_08390, partial [Stenotrophomonas sp.]